jgi:hypothetical protein
MEPLRALVIALSLVACAPRAAPPAAPLPVARPPRAALAPEHDLRAHATPARCVDGARSLVTPSEELVARCPWGDPDCEGDAPIVVRNCGTTLAKVLSVTVEGLHHSGARMFWDADPDAMQPLAPHTEVRVSFPLIAQVDRVNVRVELARNGARETLVASPRVRRLAVLSPGTGEPFGHEAPVVHVASSPDGRWTVACQALHDDDRNGALGVTFGLHGDTGGDRLRPFFLREGAAPERIDGYLGADPTGRFVALLRDRRLVLRDTLRGVDRPLDAGEGTVTRDDVSFDRVGLRMAYVRRGARTVVMVRSLAAETESVIDPGAGRLWQAWIDEAGAWVSLRMIARDGNHDGRLSAPMTLTTLASGGCRGPVTSFYRSQHVLDPIEMRVAPSTGGAATMVQGLLRPLGDALLVREATGALTLHELRGATTELVPATCSATVLDGYAPRRQVSVRCRGEVRGGVAPLEVYEPAVRRVTEFALHEAAVSEGDVLGASWVTATSQPLYDADRVYFVDRARRAVRDLRVDHEVRWLAGERALVWHGEAPRLFDLARGTSTPLHLAGTPWYPEGRGAIVRWGRSLLDVGRAVVLGEVHGDVLTTAADGRALVAATPGDDRRAPQGPLRWVRAASP